MGDNTYQEILLGEDDTGFCDLLLTVIGTRVENGDIDRALQTIYEPWVLGRLEQMRTGNAPVFFGSFLGPLRRLCPRQVFTGDLFRAMAHVQWEVLSGVGVMSPDAVEAAGMEYYATGGKPGVAPGWESLRRLYTVRVGEMTILTGIPSHFKSTWLQNLCINLTEAHGWPMGFFSPEHAPVGALVKALAECYMRHEMCMMPEEMYLDAVRWVTNRFHPIVAQEEVTPTLPWILEQARQQIAAYSIQGLIIDPWNEVDHQHWHQQAETQYISECLSHIRRFARCHGIHVWIVVHPRKPLVAQKGLYAGKVPPPTPYDCNGCYSADTEVLTDNGWKTHEMLTSSDRVACFDLKNHSFAYQFPMYQWDYEYEGPMFRFVSPSFDALVTPNHRMVVGQIWREKTPMKGTGLGRPVTYRDGWGFVEARHLASSLVMPFASGLIDSVNDVVLVNGYPADDFLKLLGWWIAEGSDVHGLSLCQAVGPLQREMESCLHRLGLSFKSSIKQYRAYEQPMWIARIYKRQHIALTNWVVTECGTGTKNKQLPALVWGLSLRQKHVLFDALIDGDGHRPSSRPGTAKYATTSTLLADQVQRLALEIGYSACISSQAGALSHHLPRYQVTVGRQTRRRIAIRMGRHRSIEPYQGKVYCLTVPTGAYLTRRNGKILIAGNSAHWFNKADNCLCVWRDAEIDSPDIEVHVQKVRFRATGRPGMVRLHYTRFRFEEASDSSPAKRLGDPERVF